MSFLIVGPQVIPVAPGSAKRDRLDAVDRARAFDLTYRASLTGNPKLDFFFSTPPVTRAQAEVYQSVLSVVAAQTCSGDIIGSSLNQVLWSEDFSNAAWTRVNMTQSGGVADPLGGTAAFTLTATAANATMTQALAVGASLVRVDTLWLKRVTGTGVINLITPDSGSYVAVPITTGWQRFTALGIASVNRYTQLQIVTNGDAVHAFGFQLEDGTTPSTYQKTTTVAVANTSISCCAELTGWNPIKGTSGHYVSLDFTLHQI